MFEELGRAIREEVVFTLFHAELALEAAADLAPQEAPTIDGGLAYSHDSMAGADAITAAFGSNGGEGGELVAVPRTEQRVVAEQEDRPQRPLLVRERQEVQEVSRGVGVHEPGATEGDRGQLDWVRDYL